MKITITKISAYKGNKDNLNAHCDYELECSGLETGKKFWGWRRDYKGFVGHFTDPIRRIEQDVFVTTTGKYKYKIDDTIS